MASLNKVQIIGNLGQDPELRHTGSGQSVCTMSIATTDKYKDKDGNDQEKTEWHRVIVWGKQGENCAKYLAKGKPCYVEGKLQTRKWTDNNQIERYSTEIVAQSVQFLNAGTGAAKPIHRADHVMPNSDGKPIPAYDLMEIPF